MFFYINQVKPSVAQVNLDVCCVVPPEMQEFTKDHEIQLLTHNDPAGTDFYSC